ncbi:MAG: hypothetical protein HS104_21970 [Polyangiaceae bacterium]|nr:hypothetical protein [Polyangiaceae bacterium]
MNELDPSSRAACQFCGATRDGTGLLFATDHGGVICQDCVEISKRLLDIHGLFPPTCFVEVEVEDETDVPQGAGRGDPDEQ